MESLQGPLLLADVPFTLPHLRLRDYAHDEPDVAEEDDLAKTLSNVVSSVVGHYLLRFLWLLRGWPFCSARWLAEGASQWVQIFRNDWKIFMKMLAMKGRTPGMSKYIDRSAFQLVATQQLVALMRGSDWAVTPEIEAFVRTSHKRLLATQCVEDAFNRQKNVEGTNYSFRYKAPDRSFHTLLRSQVLGEVHHFNEIRASRELPCRDARLPQDLCQMVSAMREVWGRLNLTLNLNP